MTPFPFRLTTGLVALAACICLPSCETTKKTGYGDVVDYTTPKTGMTKEEYPFDADGEYREDYAARGAGTRGVKDKPNDTALYTQPSDDTPVTSAAYTPDPVPTRSTASTASRSSSSSPVRRTTSSGSRSTASSKPKPKPRPKPVAKPTYVKITTGDTLYGLALKHKTTVAALKSANGLKSDTIVDGKSLKIPKKK